ncbi:MAG: DUF2507 domain-containing protein [Methanothermobacter sp.]|uniref:DUF2507 domain-containing protein n=1 Tax=Methanothermobacter sp. TaxID=1884223 RepID=UPI003C7859B8
MYDVEDLVAERPSLGTTTDIKLFRILRFMPYSIIGEGANGILYKSGKDLGRSMGLKNAEEAVKFLHDNRVGELEILEENPYRLRVDECLSCAGLPASGKALCHFEGGLLAGILESMSGRPVDLREVKCWGLGDRTCEFEEFVR